MKYGKVIRTMAILGALCFGAQAQWSLTWYADTQMGSAGLVLDNLGNNMAQGNAVYLMWDADNDGADMDSTGLLNGDAVVQLFGGGYADGTIGAPDFMFNTQDAGEFYQDSTILDAYMGQNLYVVAFQQFVQWSPAGNRFLSTGYYGTSAIWLAGGSTMQDHSFGGWQTSQSMIPEPTTMALLGAGLAGIVAYRRKKKA